MSVEKFHFVLEKSLTEIDDLLSKEIGKSSPILLDFRDWKNTLLDYYIIEEALLRTPSDKEIIDVYNKINRKVRDILIRK